MAEIIAYILIAIVALCWLCAMIFGMVMAFPYGIIGLIGIVGVGLLLLKVFIERVDNEEDDYYSKNVDK